MATVPLGKDGSARLKLLGGLLRLDAQSPGGFTAYELAAHSSVQEETARAFLNPRKGPGYAEAMPGSSAPARPDGGGRPANLYRLRPECRKDLLRQLTELRQQLDIAESVPSPTKDEVFASLERLETALQELELRPGAPEEWRSRLTEAQLELRGGKADLRALEAKTSVNVVEFSRRLSAAQERFTAIERQGPPPTLRFLDRLFELLPVLRQDAARLVSSVSEVESLVSMTFGDLRDRRAHSFDDVALYDWASHYLHKRLTRPTCG